MLVGVAPSPVTGGYSGPRFWRQDRGRALRVGPFSPRTVSTEELRRCFSLRWSSPSRLERPGRPAASALTRISLSSAVCHLSEMPEPEYASYRKPRATCNSLGRVRCDPYPGNRLSSLFCRWFWFLAAVQIRCRPLWPHPRPRRQRENQLPQPYRKPRTSLSWLA